MGLWGRRARPAPATPDLSPAGAESRSLSLSNPATARLLGDWGGHNYSGESVNETSALSLSSYYRAVSLVSQAIAALPLKTYRTTTAAGGAETRERVSSFLDNPAGPDSLTPFEWKERVVLHLLVHGNAYLYHLYSDAGMLVGLYPIHPRAVEVVEDATMAGGKYFLLDTLDGRREEVSTLELTHVLGPITDGLVGYSPLTVGRNSLGTGLAADRSAAEMFSAGAPVNGAFVPRAGEQISGQDIDDIVEDLDEHLYGRSRRGRIPILNRVLEYVDWQMTNSDAQWMEARAFNIEEVSRWTGVPPFLLMQLDKQTSWGTGIAEQNKNLSQFVLLSWCKRITEHLSRLLAAPRHVEFDMAGLEAGSAAEEIALVMSQVNGGFLTLNEGRRIRNLSPLEGGDVLRVPSGVMLQTQLEAQVNAAETVAAAPLEDAPATPEVT